MPKYNLRINNDLGLLGLKIKLRKEVLEKVDNPYVLDCYHGEGIIWDRIKKETGRDFDVFGIDRVAKYKPDWIGNNINFLRTKDISRFNIIDLDAWGSPVKQIEVLLKRKYNGYVIVTFISTIAINPDGILAESYGLTKGMVKESPAVVGGKTMDMFFDWLAKNGIKDIRVAGTDKKKYLWFYLDK